MRRGQLAPLTWFVTGAHFSAASLFLISFFAISENERCRRNWQLSRGGGIARRQISSSSAAN
jgi:hypothetical protein